jgi:hypothetical protein
MHYCIFLSTGIQLMGCLHSHAQEGGSGMRMVKTFTGFEAGLGFPYLTKGNHYKVINSHANIGVQGGVITGRIYPSGITLSAEPAIRTSFVRKTTFYRESFSQERNLVSYTREVSEEHNLLSVQIPFAMDVNVGKKVSLGGGVLIFIPVTGKARVSIFEEHLHYKWDFYETDYYEYDDMPRREPGFGFTGRLMLALTKTEIQQRWISLGYLHELTPKGPAYTHLHSFSLSLLSRNLNTKEKRQKWDRAMIKRRNY